MYAVKTIQIRVTAFEINGRFNSPIDSSDSPIGGIGGCFREQAFYYSEHPPAPLNGGIGNLSGYSLTKSNKILQIMNSETPKTKCGYHTGIWLSLEKRHGLT
jgi:hypothetical protein